MTRNITEKNDFRFSSTSQSVVTDQHELINIFLFYYIHSTVWLCSKQPSTVQRYEHIVFPSTDRLWPVEVACFFFGRITLFRFCSRSTSPVCRCCFFCCALFSSKSFQLLFYFGVRWVAIHGWLIYIRSDPGGGAVVVPDHEWIIAQTCAAKWFSLRSALAVSVQWHHSVVGPSAAS